MPAIHATISDEMVVRVPSWVIDNTSFLRWAESDEAPDKGKIGYINGTLWIDSPMEQLFHNDIKMAIGQAIRNWNQANQLGKYYGDGVVYTSLQAGFTTVPDGIFVARDSFTDGTVFREKGKRSTKLTGSPDMVLEVISFSSVSKDLTELRPLYYEAGVREYWIVDSRVDEPTLQLLNRGETEFIEVQPASGWVRSDVLQGSFRLVFDNAQDEVQLESKSP